MINWFKKKTAEPKWFDVLGLNFRKIGLALILLAVLGFSGRKLHHLYNARKEAYLASQSQQYLAKGDLRSAALSAREALQLNPINLAATRVMAEVSEISKSPAALLWRQRIAEIDPNDLDNLIAWTATALRQNDLFAADRALSLVPPKYRNHLAVHQMAAALAMSLKNYPIAEFHFAAAARLDPKDTLNQLNLASLRLLSSKPEIVQQSRDTLERLRHDPVLGYTALHSLLGDAKVRGDTNLILRLVEEVDANPKATLTDRLEHLDILHHAKNSEFAPILELTQKRYSNFPGDLAQIIGWMDSHAMAQEALTWVSTLKPDQITTQPVPMAVAECHLNLRHWSYVRETLAKQDWRELNFIRLAMLAKCARELEQWNDYRNLWKLAVANTRAEPQMLAMLGRMAQGWGLLTEAEEVWWAIARGNSNQQAALESLFRLYSLKKDARELLRVSSRVYELNHKDLVAKNNYAILALLLNKETGEARQLALENYQSNTNDTGFLTTYAFSLYKQNRAKDAVALYEKLPPQTLRDPSVAAYYGVALVAAGQKKKANPYLDLAEKSPNLLPVEQSMVTLARQGTP